jgi:hypothetical protein
MLTRLFDYVYYRIDDYYRRKPRWQGGAMGGFSAVVVMAGTAAFWFIDIMVTVWFMVLRQHDPLPSWFKPSVVVIFVVLVFLLNRRYVKMRRVLRSRYFPEPKDRNWRLKGYLIAAVVLFSCFYTFIMVLLFGEVVHVQVSP